MSTNVGSAVGYLDLDISGFLAGLQSAQSEANRQTKNIAQTIGKNMTDVGNKISSVGSTLTKTVTVPLAGIGAVGLKTAMNFEKGMSEVRAISGATGEDFDALRDKAIDLGATTAFSASEVSSAMTEMAKAGWGTQQILDGMGGVLDAAAASGEGLATVATIVADTITGFGMAASESTKVADLLTQAANSGTIGITDLGESFKYIAPVAGSMGLSIEDVTTAIAAMSMAGIKGSQAGTSLRTMLTRMVKPTDDVAAAMETLGIELTNSDGTFKSLDDIVSEMRGSFSGLTDEQKTYYATILAGQEGMSGLLSLLNLTQEEYDAIAESMYNANGIAQETATIMQDNLQSKVEQLGGSLESLSIKLGDLVIPYVQQFVEWLTMLVDKFTSLNPKTQETILMIAGIAAVAGPVILVVGKLVSGVGGLVTAFGNLSSKFGGAKSAIEGVGNAAGGAAAGASKGAASFGNLAGQALKLVAAGASFLMIAAGIQMIANAAISVADAGPGAAAAFVLLAATGVGMAAAIVAIGSASTVSAAGLLSLGASVALISGGIALLTAAMGEAMSKVMNAFANVIESVGKAALNAGKGFEMLSNSVINLVNNTGAVDLAATFGAVAKGIDEVNDAATNSSKASKHISDFSQDVRSNAQKTTIAVNQIQSDFRKLPDSTKASFNTMVSNMNDAFAKAKQNMDAFYDSMETSIDELKNLFENTKFEFNQHIKLPHFTMTGSFNAQNGTVPTVGVTWYKSAMSSGIILDAATIFGFDQRTGKFLGGGEAGSETVVGTSSLMKMIRGAVTDVIAPMIEATYQLARVSYELGYSTNSALDKQTKIIEEVVRNRGNDGGGDTYNFYSPKAIDEIEAARQMKSTKRDLAEGF